LDVLVFQLRHNVLGYKKYTGHRPRYNPSQEERVGVVVRCRGARDCWI